MAKAIDTQEAQRLDKWLWCARFYKTRSLASQAIAAGHVEINGSKPKPSRSIKAGDQLIIRREGETYHIAVIDTADRRGPASEAQGLYQETEESIAGRKLEQLARQEDTANSLRAGRPSKRDRRLIERWRQQSSLD